MLDGKVARGCSLAGRDDEGSGGNVGRAGNGCIVHRSLRVGDDDGGGVRREHCDPGGAGLFDKYTAEFAGRRTKAVFFEDVPERAVPALGKLEDQFKIRWKPTG